jgi:hypothetical protein
MVDETKAVVRALPFHSTDEVATKFVPVTLTESPLLPAGALAGARPAIAGTGFVTEKLNAPEVPPPGAGVVTVTVRVPALATSAAVSCAVRLVAET